MQIEDIFKRSRINISKLELFGFIKKNNIYYYSKNILDNTFMVEVIVKNNKLTSKVIDLDFNLEYDIVKTNINSSYVNKVREEYKTILNDIKVNCFDNCYFIFEQSNRITNYIRKKYHDEPEFLWSKFPYYGVFKNKNNNKWYSIIMNVDGLKFTDQQGEIEIINLKLNEEKVTKLLNKKGYYKAYHMNNKNWISIILDDSISDLEIISLINESYLNIDNK